MRREQVQSFLVPAFARDILVIDAEAFGPDDLSETVVTADCTESKSGIDPIDQFDPPTTRNAQTLPPFIRFSLLGQPPPTG